MSKAIDLAKKCNMPPFMRDTPATRAALERFYHAARAEALREAADMLNSTDLSNAGDDWRDVFARILFAYVARLRAMAKQEGK